MKIVDANVLLYAVNRDAPQHLPARKWLDGALSGDEAVGFAWTVILAFLRLATRHSIFPTPLTLEQAASVLEAWLTRPVAVLIEPTARHLAVLRGLLDPLGTGGNLVADAHLAALAVEHAAEVISFDNDFGRFPGLRWRMPLAH